MTIIYSGLVFVTLFTFFFVSENGTNFLFRRDWTAKSSGIWLCRQPTTNSQNATWKRRLFFFLLDNQKFLNLLGKILCICRTDNWKQKKTANFFSTKTAPSTYFSQYHRITSWNGVRMKICLVGCFTPKTRTNER